MSGPLFAGWLPHRLLFVWGHLRFQSDARSDRPQLAKGLTVLKPGDVVLVTKLDRLAQSTCDSLNIVDEIGEAGAGFDGVLESSPLDTNRPHGKLLFDVLATIGEFERKLIVARTAEGRKLAKARAVDMGGRVSSTCINAARRLRA